MAGCRIQERKTFSKLLNEGFVDTTWWWWKSRSENKGWRLDYFIISKEFVHLVKECKAKPNIMGSDHCLQHNKKTRLLGKETTFIFLKKRFYILYKDDGFC